MKNLYLNMLFSLFSFSLFAQGGSITGTVTDTSSGEALIGAIYLDQGFFNTEKFVLNIWKHFIQDSKIIELDPKTKIQEFSLKKFKKLPIYKTIKKTGPNHNPFFQVSVQIENSKKYIGQGNSKKNAEQNAASKLIRNLNI